MKVEKLNWLFLGYVDYLIEMHHDFVHWNVNWLNLLHQVWYVMIIKCYTVKNKPLYDHKLFIDIQGLIIV